MYQPAGAVGSGVLRLFTRRCTLVCGGVRAAEGEAARAEGCRDAACKEDEALAPLGAGEQQQREEEEEEEEHVALCYAMLPYAMLP